jgi:very-short-patch-repair endonuclease
MDNQQTYSTKQAIALCDALEKRGVQVKREHWDGFKHVDIHISDVNINIEVDGLQHLTDPNQIMSDFQRSYFSDLHKLNTLHITNEVLMNHLDPIADAITEVVKKRREAILTTNLIK